MIVASDDSVVRDKAIESLKKVTEFLDPIAINTKYFALCKRLRKGDIFSMRIAASALYANIYPKLLHENKLNAQRKFKKLVADDTPMVRWGAA